MRKLLLMVAALIAMGALPAAAGPIPIINENSGTCNHNTGCTFSLTFTPTDGQLLLFDPDLGFVADVITFDSATKTATIASDNVDGLGFDDLGDTFGAPPLLPPCPPVPTSPCSLTINEPPSQTLTYTPTLGQPGFGGAPVYTVTSDTHPNDVAEPSSLLLLGAGLLGVVGVMRRKLLG